MNRIYYSSDPIHPNVDLYSPECCRLIDQARLRGETRCYLGNRCFNATVRLAENGCHSQTTPAARHGSISKPGGYREVRELNLSEIQAGDTHTVHVYQAGGVWRFPSTTASGIAVPITITISQDYFEEASSMSTPTLRWQWCQIIPQTLDSTIPTLFNVPETAWLLYPDEIDTQITTASQAGEISTKIQIGVREFLIEFYPDSVYAKQVDPVANKVRLVRRSPLTTEQLHQKLTRSAQLLDPSLTCSICLDTFHATPHAPTVTLPCGHTYHGMCVQTIADTNKPCAYCRSEVDWESIMKQHGGTTAGVNYGPR